MYFFFFFFSSRRRHTRYISVTGVQTCALPILHRVIEGELGRWLPRVAAPGARLVVESSSREDITLPFQLSVNRVYGDTRVSIYFPGAGPEA